MHGIMKAVTNNVVLLLRPCESFKIEQVPRFLSYPKAPEIRNESINLKANRINHGHLMFR